jgi:succinate dehydrogenase/fumarate reductase flavoprotein subunit
MRKLTIVGGGLSGLVAAITAAERGTVSSAVTAAEKVVELLRSRSGRRCAAPAGQANQSPILEAR